MEWVNCLWRLRFESQRAVALATMVIAWGCLDSQAGVVFAPPTTQAELEAKAQEAEYKESRFGRSPAGLVFDEAQASESTPARRTAPPVRPIQRELDPPASVAVDQPSVLDAATLKRKGIQEVAVIATDSGFYPKTLFVTRDIPVRLFVTGASKSTLCVMMDSFQVRKQVRTQRVEEITFTPESAGRFRFYCPVNGMEGTLVVKEMSISESAASVAPRLPASVE